MQTRSRSSSIRTIQMPIPIPRISRRRRRRSGVALRCSERPARQVVQVLAAQLEHIETAIAALEKQLMAWHKANAVSQRLASIPGIGPIIATAIATTVADPGVFRSGREFAAWLGLVPRQNSTGGKTR